MSDPLADWRCPTCGMISSGSSNDPTHGEIAREVCRFCQAPRPDLTGWRYVEDGAYYDAPD